MSAMTSCDRLPKCTVNKDKPCPIHGPHRAVITDTPSRDNDYAWRVRRIGTDEVNWLTPGFNAPPQGTAFGDTGTVTYRASARYGGWFFEPDRKGSNLVCKGFVKCPCQPWCEICAACAGTRAEHKAAPDKSVAVTLAVRCNVCDAEDVQSVWLGNTLYDVGFTCVCGAGSDHLVITGVTCRK